MSNTKGHNTSRKRQVIFVDRKTEKSSAIDSTNDISQKPITTGEINTSTSNRKSCLRSPNHSSNVQLKRTTEDRTRAQQLTHTIQPSIANVKEKIIPVTIGKTTENELPSGENDPLNGTMTSELGTIDRHLKTLGKMKFSDSENDKENENQATFDLLHKIKHSSSAVSIGPMPLSQQACRFELPFDLKLLETLTPLEYLSKYCRLSSRRQYQSKRLFNKYRNQQHRFESSDLFLSIRDIYQDNFTHAKFASLCQLIDLGDREYQFTFDTYAGILAFCERMLYNASPFLKDYDDYHLTKDTIEKCDFDSLDRKLDGLIISDAMRRLLHAL